jgi:DNA-binding FadR family transcriptional regulator
MFKPVKSEKMYMLVVRQIESLIENGRLAPGERLPPEKELAAMFGVGRSTIREALTALEILGLVDIKTGLGIFVCDTGPSVNYREVDQVLASSTSPSEIFEARMAVEPILARFAAHRATQEDIEDMRRTLDKCDSLSQHDLESFEELDRAFHMLVARSAGNEALYKFAESINSERTGKMWGGLKRKSLKKEGRMKKYKKEHRDIFNAICDRDTELAEQLTKKHLYEVKKHLFDE